MKFKSFSKRRTLIRSIAAFFVSGIVLTPLAMPSAQAATYYWDGNDGANGFGTAGGTWAVPTVGTATSGWTTDAAGTTAISGNSITTLSTNATTDLVNFGNGTTGLAAGTINVSSTVDAGALTFAAGSGAITLAGGTINLPATSTITVNNATNTINSVLSGAGSGITKTGTGTLVLSGANTFTGVVDISAGIVNVANFTDYGVAGGLGARTAAQETSAGNGMGIHLNGGTLQYTGSTAQSTNRQIRIINGTSATIDASGSVPSATLSFTHSGTNTNLFDTGGTRTLNLTGSNTGNNTFAIRLENQSTNATSLTKSGVGTWVLTNSNTYTGTTTVSAGTLTLTGNRTVNTAAGYTMNGTGTAVLNIQNGNYGIGGTFVVGQNGGNATVNHSAGIISSVSGSGLIMGNGTSTSNYNLSGGALTISTSNGIIMGTNAGTSSVAPSVSTITVSGTGALTASTLRIGRYDTSAQYNTTNTFTQTGGTTTVTNLGMGGLNTDTASTGPIIANLNLTGGIFSATNFVALSRGGAASAANANSSFITIGGTAQVTLPAYSGAAKGTNSTATITFDTTPGGGGFLAPAAASTTYMPAGTFTNAYLTANGANFNVDSGKDITIGQVLQNAVSAVGTLTKSGAGTLTLSGANTYSGVSLISAGTLALSGTGAVNNSSGITVNGAGAKFLQTSSVAASPVVTLTQGTVTGSGTVNTVNVANAAGNVISNNDGVAGASLTIGALTFNGAATVNTFINSVSAPIVTTTLASNLAGTVTINPIATSWISNTTYDLISYGGGSIGGAGFSQFTLGTVTGLNSRQFVSGLTNSSTAITLAITGDSVYWAGDGDGTWNLASANNWKLLSNNAYNTFMVGDEVIFNDNATGGGPIGVNINAANVATATTTFNNSAKDYVFSGAFGISAGSLTKNGTGTVTIGTANTYTGATNINAGTILLSGTGTLGTGSALTLGGGRLDLGAGSINVGAVSITAPALSGDTISNGNLTGTSYAVSNATGNAIISANLLVNGAAAFTKSGAGIVTLSGTNTYTGLTTVSGGTLKNGSATTFTNKGALSLSGTAIFDLGGFNSAFTSLSASVAGNTITNTGTSDAVLAFSNQGNTAIASKIVDGSTNKTAVSLVNNVSSTPLLLTNNTNSFSGGLTLAYNATTGAGGTRLRITSLISGTPFGTGAITIGQANTDKAQILLDTVTNNTLANDIIVNTALGTDVAGSFRVDTAGNTFSGKITANLANAKFNVAGSASLTGQVTGPFGLEFNVGAGTLTLNNTGTANNYVGNTIIGTASLNSKLALGSSNQIPNGSGVGNVVLNGTLNLNGNSDQINGLSGGSTGVVDGVSGTPILTVGDNDATGAANTFAGVIKNTAGSLAVTKIGSGTLTLSGANTYTGITTVSAGKLVVDGSTTSNTTVLASATLGGSGTINGSVSGTGNVASGSSIESLTINGTYNITGFQQFEVTAGAGPLANSDKIDGITALTYGGTLQVINFNAGTFAAGNSWDLYDFSTPWDNVSMFANNSVFGVAGGGDGINLPMLGATESWNFDYGTGVLSIQAIPEPSTLVLGGLALLGFAGVGLRRRRLAKQG